MVFPACDDTIDQLKNLVRIIVNEFSGANILITADHGFLYTYSPLTEDDKVGKESFNGRMWSTAAGMPSCRKELHQGISCR